MTIRYGGKAQFADDALFIDAETTPSDVRQFLVDRIEKPHVFGDVTVWNFSSYAVDEDALKRAANGKLNREHYVIPFQVAGTWAMMFNLLPSTLKRAEVLVYQPDRDDYFAYQNFYRMQSDEQRTTVRQDLARRLSDVLN